MVSEKGAKSSSQHYASPNLLHSRSLILCGALFILALSYIFRPIERLSLLSQQLVKPASFSLLQARSSASGMSYAKELRLASLAVQRATILTQKVFHETSKGTLSKDDKSPVTIGDFGAQALIISAIRHAFPGDSVVGEEEASSLRSNQTLSSKIFDLVSSTSLSSSSADAELGGPIKSEEAMLEAIDAGNSAGGAKGRFWALDPIDGTKGFLRGGQYAVCLALIVDGEIVVGVLGCPNLPVDNSAPMSASIDDPTGGARGVLFSAVASKGANSAPIGTGDLEKEGPISMKSISNVAEASFCESVEAGHSSHGDQAEIASKLGIKKPSVRMDSQSKYGSIARGAGDIYLRLPVSKTYVEKIWDHAAGDLIVREAGGAVTDVQGQRLDFSKGRTLTANKGVVAARKELHPEVLVAVKSVLEAKK